MKRFTTLLLSVGPVDIYEKGEEARSLAYELINAILGYREQLDGLPNDAMLRDHVPAVAASASLLAWILSDPTEGSPVQAVPGEIVVAHVPRWSEPLTLRDLAQLVGALEAQLPDVPLAPNESWCPTEGTSL